jgi:hypothetical protein
MLSFLSNWWYISNVWNDHFLWQPNGDVSVTRWIDVKTQKVIHRCQPRRNRGEPCFNGEYTPLLWHSQHTDNQCNNGQCNEEGMCQLTSRWAFICHPFMYEFLCIWTLSLSLCRYNEGCVSHEDCVGENTFCNKTTMLCDGVREGGSCSAYHWHQTYF